MAAPDEIEHFSRAASLSEGEVLTRHAAPPANPKPEDIRYHAQSGGFVDQGVIAFGHAYYFMLRDPARPPAASTRAQADAISWTGQRGFQATPGASVYFPAIYLPQAAALGLGRALGLPLVDSYQLARAAVLGLSLAILAVSLAIHRMPVPVLAVVLMPMAVFQTITPVIDGLLLSMAVLALALLLRFVTATGRRPQREVWAFAGVLFLLVTCRPQLAPMLVLPILLGGWQRDRRQWVAGAMVAASSLGWIVFAVGRTVDNRTQRQAGAGEIVRFYLEAPSRLLDVMSATLEAPLAIQNPLQAMVGVLGWLDAPLPSQFYPLLWGLFTTMIILAIACGGPWWSHVRWRLVLLVVALGSIVAVYLAMLVGWTPHPARTIEGIQGRYFLIPALLLVLAAVPWPTEAPAGWRRWSMGLLAGLYAAVSLVALVAALGARYH